MSWTDTHTHLADSKFDEDRPAAIERAQQASVHTLVEIGESADSWDGAIRLAEAYPFFYATLGIHPHYAHHYNAENWDEIEKRLSELLQHPRVVAVGEFGLDYFRMQNTKEEQNFLFRKQVEIALKAEKPVVFHCRDAHDDLRKLVAEYFPAAVMPAKAGIQATPELDPGLRRGDGINGVIHCFSGNEEEGRFYIEHGFMLGVDGPITYPSAKSLQAALKALPLESLVLETDSPYLPPQAFRGQRNESSYIPIIGEGLAVLKGIPAETVKAQTTRNAKSLFQLN